mmetsp:Transcript_55240/g.157235  ORF Transcript_55240/g.157235 Transcript_55240/m.157235 type:complete len:221 (+) Transcript_55240:1290-1952(+)
MPSSCSASSRACSLESATAATTAASSPSSSMLRMCSLPMAPVPMIPTRMGAAAGCTAGCTAASASGSPRRDASTRRGGVKVSRACITRVLSMKRMSPWCHSKATRRSCMNWATPRIACASTGEPSPSTTAFSPTFRESFHPVKAAIMELKKTRFPVRPSTRSAGKMAVVVRQSPLGSHSYSVPCRRMAFSASSRVDTLYVSFQERPCAEVGSVTSGITRM